VVDEIRAGSIALVVNTTVGAKEIRDSYSIRRGALLANIPYFTTIEAAMAAVSALEVEDARAGAPEEVRSLQEWHARR
jgi:carbamoyl-phosphate synthase large subunit